MPAPGATGDAHLRQARHNEALARRLATEGAAPDWVVIACFYSALHYLDHWFEARGVVVDDLVRRHGVSGHAARARLLREHLGGDAEIGYRSLRMQSELARYVVAGNGAVDPVTVGTAFGTDGAEEALRTLRGFRASLGYGP